MKKNMNKIIILMVLAGCGSSGPSTGNGSSGGGSGSSGSSSGGTVITVPDCTVNDAGQKVKACGPICIPNAADCCDETTGRFCHPGNICNGNGCSTP